MCFFFKQKTAYEMRISDWSSDVCSSDLRIRLSDPTVEQIVSHIVDKRGFYFHGNRKHKNAWLPHDQKQAEALCLLAINIGSLKIGRASCRERVCQYV